MIVFQILAGSFYLLNKIFFMCSELVVNQERKRLWRIWSWIVYLAGVLPWLIIFYFERNWIIGAVELGGAPAMVLGLVYAIKRGKEVPGWLDILAFVAIVVGAGFSFYDFGGIHKLTQWLELCVSVSFLTGTYMLAKEKLNGYVSFMIMNVSTAALMGVQGYRLLMVQQIISLGFVIAAYVLKRRAHE